jgi:hypothetical protein
MHSQHPNRYIAINIMYFGVQQKDGTIPCQTETAADMITLDFNKLCKPTESAE